MRARELWVLGAIAAACGDDARESASATSLTGSMTVTVPLSASATDTEGASVTESTPTGTATQGLTGGTSGPMDTGLADTTGTKFDVTAGPATDPDETTGPPIDACKVQGDMDAVGECDQEAPADSFEAEIQWTWPGANGEIYAVATPLVANLTDDNGDGEIDLCDVPDLVVVASVAVAGEGHIYVLDGATGAQHFMIPTPVDATHTPALGDIDGDGLPEIVTSAPQQQLNAPLAFEHDGALKWMSATASPMAYIGATALADLDNDGDVEIISGDRVFDHLGVLVFVAPQGAPLYAATAAADLDGDGDLEVVIGASAHHHDGALYYHNMEIQGGFPQIANLDGDPQPEVLVTSPGGITVLEHDGTTKFKNLTPTGDPPINLTWHRPATVQDFDGDDISDFAVSSANNYTTYHNDATILWKAVVSDQSGIAAGTAFDFLGDGIAEAMYADEQFMFVFGGSGEVLLSTPRTSLTGIEYPIVADIDNDGSAEIVVVSNQFGDDVSPPVQVIRDKQDRWIQARRIWNQHTYHVTNVREDGTIPQFEPPSWQMLNTYRTNAQIEGGGVCEPPIPQ